MTKVASSPLRRNCARCWGRNASAFATLSAQPIASSRTCSAGLRIGDFRKAWATACRLAGVPGRLVHDFRRTAVRNLERAGVPRSAAMKMTGHKTEAVYSGYAITDSAMLQEAAIKLAVLHAADAGSGENRKSTAKVSTLAGGQSA